MTETDYDVQANLESAGYEPRIPKTNTSRNVRLCATVTNRMRSAVNERVYRHLVADSSDRQNVRLNRPLDG